MPIDRLPDDTPPLTPEQSALVLQWRFLPLAAAKKNAGLTRTVGGRDEAVSIGTDALIRSAMLWSAAHGAPFSAYAKKAIWSALYAEAQRGGVVRRKSGDRYGVAPLRFCPLDPASHLPAPQGMGGNEPDRREALLAAIDKLPPQEAHVIRRRMLDEATLETVSREIGRTKECVRQTQLKALARLRLLLAGLKEEVCQS